MILDKMRIAQLFTEATGKACSMDDNAIFLTEEGNGETIAWIATVAGALVLRFADETRDDIVLPAELGYTEPHEKM